MCPSCSRIGPGIFFALFGAGILAYSVTKPFSVGDTIRNVTTESGERSIFRERTMTGIDNGAKATSAGPSMDRRKVVGVLNRLSKSADGGKMIAALNEAKLVIVAQSWQPGWGSFADFRRWVVERVQQGNPPEGVEPAAELFAAEE